MENFYEQLMEFDGAHELQHMVEKWEVLSENINKRSFDAPIILPDLLMYTKPGFGNTTLLTLLAEYLDSKKNLMSFYGDVKFFEFKLGYCSPGESFNELYRFMDVAKSAAGFRNEFKGIVRVNIDEWVEHYKEKYFYEFLQYLQSNTHYWLVILTISNRDEDETTKELEGIISMYLRVQKVTLHLPDEKGILEFAAKQFAKYGLELDSSAEVVLTESIKILRNNKYFDGLNTIVDLCRDIVYDLFTSSTSVSGVITGDMLADFSKDSDYIKRTSVKIEKKTTIGF